MSTKTPQDDPSCWYLEGFVDAGRNSWRTVIHSLPLTVGREKSADLQLRSDKVSHRHAEIYFSRGLRVRDLGSTNGTYVNGRRVRGTRQLVTGDVIRFADLELRLASYGMPPSTGTKALTTDDLKEFLAEQSEEFLRLLETQAIRPLFQPLFDLGRLTIVGYELLCRGNLEGFETSPTELFFIAERLGRDIELSQLFRDRGVTAAAQLPGRPKLFVNTHPSEIQDLDGFLDSIRRLHDEGPPIDLVVEIHEAAMTEPQAMKKMRTALHELGIQLAFDDFGTGQSRLQALADVPPDYLKFDLTFVRGLDRASERRKTLVRRLVEMAGSIGIVPIAEGIETPEELQACVEAGFRSAQGYLLAEPLEPAAISELSRGERDELLGRSTGPPLRAPERRELNRKNRVAIGELYAYSSLALSDYRMFDSIDSQILNILQSSARTTNVDIAREVGMAPSATLERIRKLEARGTIRGYEARIEPQALGLDLLAFINVRSSEVPGKAATGDQLAAIPEVLEVHHVAGEDCYLVKMRAANPEALGRILREQIGRIPTVTGTRTTIVLGTLKETSRLPVSAALSKEVGDA